MDDDPPSSEQECSEPNQEFPLPVITNVFSLAVNPTGPNGIPETTADSAWLVEEGTNTNPGMLPDGVCAPRVRKKMSDRKYEIRPRVNSQVSPAVAAIQIVLPITIDPASLILMPAGFDQPQTSTDLLSQEPRALDAAQPSGYQSSFGVTHSPSTKSALLYVQQPGEQPSYVPSVPVIATACSSHVPSATISRPPQHSQYSTEVIEEAMALTSGYSDVFMDHPSLTESATDLH
ncbi:hypothetical protein HPB51_026905 [Rhipicephalus microplus]|uniref:Uncharacterized protein n=1 Tax=Rhipicephalus microplus TaxID=6941 RepID=A0A9J6D1U1_RHIMP|nr:hypothetical protein HPB51_026905 [Rhipicephalus microplus]